MPSKGPGPASGECGRSWKKEGRKRALKVLERWPYDPGSSLMGPQQGKPVKRFKGAMPGKGNRRKGRLESMQNTALLGWLNTAKEGLEAKTGPQP